MARPIAVIFDLYETLVSEFDPDWREQPSIAARLGLDEVAFSAAWRAHHRQRACGSHPEFASALREICAVLGRQADDAALNALQAERLAVKARPFAAIRPDIVTMLARLAHEGVKLGLISNCAPEEVAAWPACALAPYFDAVVFSHQVGLAKPDPRIYRCACQRLAIGPEEAIFVGDGGSDELSGAALAGLTPYWATWFLDAWPSWKSTGSDRVRSATYPQLCSPAEVVTMVSAARQHVSRR